MALGYGRVATNNFSTAKFIVDTNGISNGATHSTIAAAITDASAGDTIFIREGTYTEDLTVSKNLSFIAYGTLSQVDNVTVSGKWTISADCLIQGIELSPNGDVSISTSANITILESCKFATNAFSTLSLSGGEIRCHSCASESGKIFDVTGGILTFSQSFINGSSVVSTASAGTVNIYNSRMVSDITTSVTAAIRATNSSFNGTLILGGSGSQRIDNCIINSGSDVALTCTTTVTITNSTINSTNATAAIDGAGTINYGGLTFAGSADEITTTAQSVLYEGPSRTIGSANVGGTNTLKVENTNNSDTGSHAEITIDAGGTSGGDPFVRWNVPSGQDYSMGIDNSDSDKLTITDDANPSTGNVLWEMTAAGERTMPLQPAFLAVNSTTDTNQTGAGTPVTVEFDSEKFDQNGDYNNTTDTFTAPVTGRYNFNFQVTITAFSAAMTDMFTFIVTSNGTYYGSRFNPVNASANSWALANASVTLDMDASDTAYVRINVQNGAGDTASIMGSNNQTYFSGFLVC